MKRSSAIPFFLGITLYILFVSLQVSAEETVSTESAAKHNKTADLVLIHGLANKHKWSENFLEECLRIWGSGRVFVVYTGPGTTISSKSIQGQKIIFAGGENNAGTGSITHQVANLKATIHILQEKHGLSKPFSIIAHSMGGLVSRQFSYTYPEAVAGLVTLGTPHLGSPLANSFQWAGFFMNASEAIEDLKPENVAYFNTQYTAEKTPLALSDTFHTIRGTPGGKDCYGWIGELFFGWQILYHIYEIANDGLVPYDSAIIKGSNHIGDFPHYDHYDLVRKPDVVKLAAEYLP